MTLSDLPRGHVGTVRAVTEAHPNDAIARRLKALGFVQGERVRLVTRGPFGGDPLLVQVGGTRFALRLAEAARVRVRGDEVLTVRKEGTSRFMLVGGKLEPGESARDAALRETSEEVSIDLASVQPLGEFWSDAANEPGHRLH